MDLSNILSIDVGYEVFVIDPIKNSILNTY